MEKRVIRPSKRYGYGDLIAFALIVVHKDATDEPRSYLNAINRDKSKEWIKVMNEEIMSLMKNHT